MLTFEQLERRDPLDFAMFYASEVLDYQPGRGVAAPYDDPTRALGYADTEFVSLGEGGYIALGFPESVHLRQPSGCCGDFAARFWEEGTFDGGNVLFSDDYGGTWHDFGHRYGGYIKAGPEIRQPLIDGTVYVLNPAIQLETFNALLILDDGSLDGYTNAHAGIDLDAVRIYTLDATPGDANRDGIFDTADIGQVVLAAKYNTGMDATWEEGDWNRDRVFDQLDLVWALRYGSYMEYRDWGPPYRTLSIIDGHGSME